MLMWARTLYSCKLVEDINCPQKINPTSDSLCYVNKGYSVVEFWQRMLLKLYTNADLLPPATAIWPNRSVGHCLAEAETGARGERQGGGLPWYKTSLALSFHRLSLHSAHQTLDYRWQPGRWAGPGSRRGPGRID